MTRGFSVGVACLLGALVSMSCDEDEAPPTVLPIDDAAEAFVEAWCERLASCECDPEWVPTQSDCQYQVEAIIGGLRDVGEDGGLLYDGACLGAEIDRLDDRGCDPDRRSDSEGCEAPCYPFHGTRGLGKSCEEFGNFSDCAQGLRCENECESGTCVSTCRDPCARVGIGEDCFYEGQCEDDAICVFDETSATCRRLPEVGEPCLQNSCADGSFCVTDPVDPTIQTCTAPAPLGEACMGHVQCVSGYCPAGFCEELPGKGDACFGTCAQDLDCDFESGKCIAAEPGVCDDHPL